jgi:hypothetical protein
MMLSLLGGGPSVEDFETTQVEEIKLLQRYLDCLHLFPFLPWILHSAEASSDMQQNTPSYAVNGLF